MSSKTFKQKLEYSFYMVTYVFIFYISIVSFFLVGALWGAVLMDNYSTGMLFLKAFGLVAFALSLLTVFSIANMIELTNNYKKGK